MPYEFLMATKFIHCWSEDEYFDCRMYKIITSLNRGLIFIDLFFLNKLYKL